MSELRKVPTVDIRIAELEWLSKQPLPMWGGHLERGEPASDPQLRSWVTDGIVEAVEQPCKGYVLTEKGRRYLAERH